MTDDRPPLDSVNVNVYTALIRLRNQELATHWSRYNIFAAANFGLLLALFATEQPRVRELILCLVGICIAAAWLQITVGGKKLLTGRWERYLIEFEASVAPAHGYFEPVFTQLAEKEGRKRPGQPLPSEEDVKVFSARSPQFYVPVATVIAWIVLLGFVAGTTPAPSSTERIQSSLDRLTSTAADTWGDIVDLSSRVDQIQATVAETLQRSAAQRPPNTALEPSAPARK